MLRRLSATPCPNDPIWQQPRPGSHGDQTEDLTANVDFTTEFKASFRHVKPRRPPRPQKAPNIGFTIHEDVELRLDGSQPDRDDKGTTTTRPPADDRKVMEPNRRVSFSLDHLRGQPAIEPPQTSGLAKAPRRQSIRMEPKTDVQVAPNVSTKIAKPARRGTIFIPSDDTTMPTMFMDIFSPLKGHGAESFVENAGDPNLTGLALQMAQKRGRRSSVLAMSPKRAPLNLSQRPLQPAAIVTDRPGHGPGKENRPPGHEKKALKKMRPSMAPTRPPRVSLRDNTGSGPPPAPRTSRLFEPTASSAARLTQVKRKQPVPKTTWNSNFLLPRPKSEISTSPDFGQGPEDQISEMSVTKRPPVPSRFVVPSVQQPECQGYAFVPEGVADTSMYEDNWLGQQEIAITQLLNNLFSAASLSKSHEPAGDLDRLRLLEMYGSNEMSVLYKRLQASLAHGPLSLGGEGALRGQQLNSDLAKRRSFVEFWVHTYTPQLLRLGLEVVIGRVVPLRTSGPLSGDVQISGQNTSSNPVQRFIEKFLIRNEDIRNEDERGDRDVTRPLKNIDYVVSHEQYPLQEYEYKVKNLAVDIRDGVRLTRLIELLLYRGASQALNYGRDLDATTNITINSGQTICLAEGNQDWPISQHLKVPCDSRTIKLYNVDLALASLREVRGISGYLKEVTAADIVDGFREKTVRLLWLLCSKYGLGSLVDDNDLKSEIKRLGQAQGKVGSSYLASFEIEEDADDNFLYLRSSLRAWVKAVAASRGLRVRNFTDFADGRIFDAIVSEYEAYMPGGIVPAVSGELSYRLKRLGCSNDFANLFSSRTSRHEQQHEIFDRDFVLASVAFLASRLLRPTKATRAAVTLQRAWRRKLERIVASRKVVLRTLAAECARHKRFLQAKMTIWRTWGKYRARTAERSRAATSRSAEEDVWLSL
ncbi:uncharacterized protein AB675_10643 [Cyphellophora attinorum]|uniref:Calponin-homology (CH) domain-containing protein n=1 Tax=Cyphellophora attinorum TaxID=1664694 RepID=A0A0N1HR73_9EURO|nr:uncharacterized protein AB675_10643 [Phialophora attinorum]KPI40672.1 hypothetical protein AB675_10643 [Phialophora attinorum]